MNYQEFADELNIHVRTPAGPIPLKLRDYQLNLLNAFDKNDTTIVNKARQIGATTILRFYALYYSMVNNNPPTTVAIVPDRNKCCKYLKEDMEDIISNFPKKYDNIFKHIDCSGIVFNNGSEIMFGNTVQRYKGTFVSVYLFDEFAFNTNDKELYKFIQEPPLHKKEVYVSTPNGMKNEFYNLCKYGSKNDKIRLDHTVILERSRVEELKRMCDIKSFRQEYECWFNPEDVQDKTEVMNIRLTPGEKEDMEYIAKVKGFRSLSDYIRFLANRDQREQE